MRKYLVDITLAPYYKKPFFGSEYLYFKDFYNQSAILSRHCMVLGFLYNENIGILLELLGNQKSELESNISGISQMAESLEIDASIEIKNSHDLFSEAMVKLFPKSVIKQENFDFKNPQDLIKIQNLKVPSNSAIVMTEMMIYGLIGYGYKYPEKTKKLLTYKINEKEYDLALKSGLNIPKEQKELVIEDHINFAKELIVPYVSKNNPELMRTLEL